MACICETVDGVSFGDFLPYILPSAGEIPDEIAAHKAREASIELARITKILKRTLYVDEQAGVQNYSLHVPDYYSFLQIDYVRNNCRDLPVNRDPDPFQTMYAYQKWYAFDKPDVLYINPVPRIDKLRGIEVRVVVIPGQDTCYIDQCFYDEYAEDIANGALMRLYRMKAEDWYDPNLAREHERLWRDALRLAKVRSLKGNSAAPLMMQAGRWA